MFAKVALILAQRQDVAIIPRDALRMEGDQAVVCVVQNGIVHLRQVTTGLQSDTQVEILAGLSSGAEIVFVGHQGLKDQAPVRVVQTVV